MKLRQQPSDFRVRERLEADLDPAGAWGLYRLEKRGSTTEAAVAELARRLRMDRRQVGVGGLKDAHAETAQHITLPGPAQPRLTGRGWVLQPLGRVREPLRPGATSGNAFEILIRDLTSEQARSAVDRAAQARAGVPNYFDAQRFGSLAGGQGFAAKEWIAGRFEEGLKNLLATTYRGMDAREKRLKDIVAKGWGNWAQVASALPPSEAQGVAGYLRDHPGAFSGALRRLHETTRWRTMAAYQSHLFNEILQRHLRRTVPGGVDVEIRSGILYFPLEGKAEPAALARERWPLPRKNVIVPPGIEEDVAAVLQREGTTMDALKVAGARLDFPKGERAPWVIPEGLKAEAPVADELNQGKSAVKVSFALPPGSYATVVIKRLTYDCRHTFRG